ncbi:MAG: hypothetical protein ACQPRJ_05780 [Solitalea-like symbiont of Acarus siro]
MHTTKNGYEEIVPPFIVNYDSAFATGQLPDKDEQMYHIQKDNFYLMQPIISKYL